MARYDDDDDDDFRDRNNRRRERFSGNSDALGRLAAPAIILIVLASIHLVLIVVGIPLNLLGAFAQQPKGFEGEKTLQAAQIAYSLVTAAIGLCVQGFIVYGSLQMKSGANYGVAMATAILSVIPCFCSSCAILGLPFGIWALVVLNDPEVKSAFR